MMTNILSFFKTRVIRGIASVKVTCSFQEALRRDHNSRARDHNVISCLQFLITIFFMITQPSWRDHA